MFFFDNKNLCVILLMILIHIIFLYTSMDILAQSQTHFTLTGYIKEESGKPISNADVYLFGTTLGDMTDQTGKYSIKYVPQGNYELVVSMMGYEIKKIKIAIYQSTLKRFDLKLKPKVIPGKEVKVIAVEPKEWKKNLKILKEVFFGVKEFSKECKFLNPEYINIEYSEVLQEFKAYADEPIRFENKALGYEVTFELKEFFIKLKDRGGKSVDEAKYKNNKKTCVVQFYKELVPKNDGERKKWMKNRQIAFNGSQRHFLKSLCEGRLSKEGFEIYTSPKITHWRDSKNLRRIKSEKLINESDNDLHRILSFHNYLMVMYKKEKNDVIRDAFDYSRDLQNREMLGRDYHSINQMYNKNQSRYQISWIHIYGGQEIIINTNGYIVPIPGSANLAIVNGYWLWDCPAEWLPYNYQPEK